MKEPFILNKEETHMRITCQNENIIAGITTRKGGISEYPFQTLNMGWHVQDDKEKVQKNYELIAKQIDFPIHNWISAKQIHSTKILLIDETTRINNNLQPPNYKNECDAFLTKDPNILLTAVFADCVPLYFYTINHSWIGLAHAGWRGTVNGMGPRMVQKFKEKGVPLEEIRVVIGPSISASHYEVDDFVVQNIPIHLRKEPILYKNNENHYLFDLKQLHKELLLEEGILEESIAITKYCSFQDKDLFYSHRRDNGKTGRMMAFIGFKEL